jgi:hypothetical protein
VAATRRHAREGAGGGSHQEARAGGCRSRAPGGARRREQEQGTRQRTRERAGYQRHVRKRAGHQRRAREGAGGGTVVARREGCEQEMLAGFVVGTRVSSKMGFGCYWADWADIGKQVGQLMHASRPKSTSRRQVARLARVGFPSPKEQGYTLFSCRGMRPLARRHNKCLISNWCFVFCLFQIHGK